MKLGKERATETQWKVALWMVRFSVQFRIEFCQCPYLACCSNDLSDIPRAIKYVAAHVCIFMMNVWAPNFWCVEIGSCYYHVKVDVFVLLCFLFNLFCYYAVLQVWYVLYLTWTSGI
ncbi:hypothetical protein ACH5RR_027302 [Cinchona calisaya]|uniref:Uncharacterized protein n=1 Tax=Cinchona calisaya TaxID=153742 RepID=A0ABD2Z8C8_9GENT